MAYASGAVTKMVVVLLLVLSVLGCSSPSDSVPRSPDPSWQKAYDSCFEQLLAAEERRSSYMTRDRIPPLRLDYFRSQCEGYADRLTGRTSSVEPFQGW